MCGCSNFVNNDEKEFITQAESNRGFDFTGNRPSIIEVGEDPSFDFTGNRPSVIEVGEDPSFDFMSDIESKNEFEYLIGKKAKARRQERRAKKQGQDTTTTTQADVENNTLRGKIYIQPTRAVEFISIDFVVTNQGALI